MTLAPALRLGNDGCAGTAVEVDQQQHLGTIGQCLFGLGLLGSSITFGVGNREIDASGSEGCAEELAAVIFPTGR